MIRLIRHIPVFALIVAMVVASSGVVLVARLPSLPRSRTDEWFACKDHLCGCISAEMCRTNCCCDKLAIRPVAEHAKGSCCEHDDEKQVEVSVAIHSAGCSGVADFEFVKAAFWIIPIARFEPRLFLSPSRPVEAPAVFPESLTLLPDPPPPRAC